MKARVEVREDGQVVLHDPDALAVARAVGKHNCRLTFEAQADRVRHFANRAAATGRASSEVVVVLLNVDDAAGAALADILMPGHDWQAYRDRGEVPFARGLAGREGIQECLDEIDPEAGRKLRAARRLSVVVVDYGTADVFEVPS